MKPAIYSFHPERKQKKKRNIFERIRFLEKKTYKVRLIFQSIDHINTY